MLCTLLAANVIVVGPIAAPGVDYTSIQAAVAAAAPGDILLVRPAAPGTYSGDLALGGKALTIVADGALVPELAQYGRLTVNGLAAGATTALRGFHLPGVGFLPAAMDGGTVAFQSSPGTLLVEDCSIVGSQSGISASNSGWLGVSKCTSNATTFFFGEYSIVGVGLYALATTTTLHASESRGGPGTFITIFGNPVALAGGSGATAAASTLVVSRSQLIGGDGGGSTFSQYFGACMYSPGGPGLYGGNAGTLTHLLATTTSAGGPGGLFDPCTTPPPVADKQANGGTWTEPGGAAPVLDSSPVTREGQTLAVALDSTPGEFGVLLVATSVQPVFVSAYYGPLLHPAASLLPLGLVPSSGSATASAPIQDLGAGVEGAVLYLQGVSVDPATLAVRLSNVSVSVLADAAL